MLQLPDVLGTIRKQIEPCRVDGAVAKDVRQLDDVPVQQVKGLGEQVPQIMGKHLAFRHACRAAQPLHFRPDLHPAQRAAAPCEKDPAGGDAPGTGVAQQLPAEFSGNENRADFLPFRQRRLPA